MTNQNNERRISIMLSKKSKANIDFAMALFENSKSSFVNNLLESITPEIILSAKCLSDETGKEYQNIIRETLLRTITPKNTYKLNWIKRLYDGEISENVCRDIFNYLISLLRKGVEINTEFSREIINIFLKNAKCRIKLFKEYSAFLSYETHLLHDLNILTIRILNSQEKRIDEKEKATIKKVTEQIKQSSIMSICYLLLDNWEIVKHCPETYSLLKSLVDLNIDYGEYNYSQSNELIHVIFRNKIII